MILDELEDFDRQLLELKISGKTWKQIAAALRLSVAETRYCWSKLLAKLHVKLRSWLES